MIKKTLLIALTALIIIPFALSGESRKDRKAVNKAVQKELGQACLCRKAKILGGTGTIDDPIVIKARNRDYAIDCQLRYISMMDCDSKQTWKITDRVFVTEEGKRRIEKIEISCASSQGVKNLYFDMTGSK